MRAIKPADWRIDIAVVTHVGSNHSGGMIPLLTSDLAGEIRAVRYNGRTHRPGDKCRDQTALRLRTKWFEDFEAAPCADRSLSMSAVLLPLDPATSRPIRRPTLQSRIQGSSSHSPPAISHFGLVLAHSG